MSSLPVGSQKCACPKSRHKPRFVVLTGGPGGGKTAILEIAKLCFCGHVVLLPEAAGIVFGGGFPRLDTPVGRRASQRTIYQVQNEMLRLVEHNPEVAMVLCDRGTVDGLAYWPGSTRSYFDQVGSTMTKELARYAAVIHIATPSSPAQYHRNSIRRESLAEARAIDARIRKAWSEHPRQMVIEADSDFFSKAAEAIEAIRAEVPACCRISAHTEGLNKLAQRA